jgi:glucose/arabinose dehydrogenase
LPKKHHHRGRKVPVSRDENLTASAWSKGNAQPSRHRSTSEPKACSKGDRQPRQVEGLPCRVHNQKTHCVTNVDERPLATETSTR